MNNRIIIFFSLKICSLLLFSNIVLADDRSNNLIDASSRLLDFDISNNLVNDFNDMERLDNNILYEEQRPPIVKPGSPGVYQWNWQYNATRNCYYTLQGRTLWLGNLTGDGSTCWLDSRSEQDLYRINNELKPEEIVLYYGTTLWVDNKSPNPNIDPYKEKGVFRGFKTVKRYKQWKNNQLTDQINVSFQFNGSGFFAYMFEGNSELEELNMYGQEDISRGEPLNRMFSGNTSLKKLNLGGYKESQWNTKDISMINMFQGLENLEELTLAKYFKFNGYVGLPKIGDDEVWYNAEKGIVFNTSEEFVKNYNGLEHSGTFIRTLRKPSLEVSLNIEDKNASANNFSDFAASLEVYNNNSWELFNPEDNQACQNLSFDTNGKINLTENTKNTQEKQCFDLIKDNLLLSKKQVRFILTKSPEYYPKRGLYSVIESGVNPIASNSSNSLSNINFEINTVENKWGTCPWDLNDDGMLTLNKQSASYCTLGRGNYIDDQVAGIPKQKVTSINFISKVKLPSEGAQFFYKFKQVQKYDRMENLDTSQATSMKDMFKSNLSLQELDLSHFNTSNVTSMESMFANLLEVKTLDLSSFNTSKVTDMHSMFQIQKGNEDEVGQGDVKSKLETIKFPNSSECSQNQEKSCWNTQQVTKMDYMFHNQDKLKSLDVSLFDTKKVDDMMKMFSGTNSLQKLNLSNFNTENVTNMNSMFLNNHSLQELDLSNFDTKKVTDMSNMFAGSNAIEQLHLGKNFQFQPSDKKTQAALPNITPNNMYTGGWVNLDRGNSFESSEALMYNYNGQNDFGTYTRQKKTYLYVPETINFSGLLNYNEPQSIEPSSDATVLASSYEGNWKVMMNLDSSSNDLFKKYLYYDDKYDGKKQISISNGKEILKGNEGQEKELVLPLTMELDPLASLDPLVNKEYVGKLEYRLEITL